MNHETMTRIDMIIAKKVMDIRDTKGKEYATEEDTLADFKEVAAEAGITPLQCWATYVKKHQRAIDTYIREGSVKSEAIEGRILDVIVYHHLLLGLIAEGPAHSGSIFGSNPFDVPEPASAQVPMAHRGPPQQADLGQHEDITSSYLED